VENALHLGIVVRLQENVVSLQFSFLQSVYLFDAVTLFIHGPGVFAHHNCYSGIQWIAYLLSSLLIRNLHQLTDGLFGDVGSYVSHAGLIDYCICGRPFESRSNCRD
jgi:hypothetical protein